MDGAHCAAVSQLFCLFWTHRSMQPFLHYIALSQALTCRAVQRLREEAAQLESLYVYNHVRRGRLVCLCGPNDRHQRSCVCTRSQCLHPLQQRVDQEASLHALEKSGRQKAVKQFRSARLLLYLSENCASMARVQKYCLIEQLSCEPRRLICTWSACLSNDTLLNTA